MTGRGERPVYFVHTDRLGSRIMLTAYNVAGYTNGSVIEYYRYGPYGTAVFYGDAATCRTRWTQGCLTEVGARGTGLTSSAVADCAAGTVAASCTDILVGPIEACAIQAGTLANGAPRSLVAVIAVASPNESVK